MRRVNPHDVERAQRTREPARLRERSGSRFQRSAAPAASGEATQSPSAPLSFLLESRPPAAVRHRDRTFRRALLAADVVAAVIVVALVALRLHPTGPWWAALVLPVVVAAGHAAAGLYARDERLLNKSTLEEAPILFHAGTLATMVAFLVVSVPLQTPLGATVVGATWLGLVLLVPACRVLARFCARRASPPERCLVIGDHEHGWRLAAKLREQVGVKAELVGVLPLADGAERPTDMLGRLAAVIEAEDVHRVVIACDADAPQRELETIQAAKALGVGVSVLPRVFEVVGSAASYDYVDGLTVLGVPRFGLTRWDGWVKRALDLGGAGLAVALFSPVMLVIALAIRLTSPGPILFRQTRIGRDGRGFDMLKFRSMHDGADSLKDGLRDRNEADGLFKITHDPRITRLGRVLRRTSLDELPQLFNVLRGEMSLVGPRPLVPEEDGRIQGWHRRRLHLTPGMTGPWQVLGSARIPLREMVTIDYLYVANWSLWTDVKILLRTMSAVAGRRGR